MNFSFGHEKNNCRRFPLKTPADGTQPFEDIPSDVTGSYTGMPYDADDDQPIQDADDL